MSMLKRHWLYVIALVILPIYIRMLSHVRPLIQTIWAGDTLMIADGGARILEGKSPHTDYFSPIGVLTQAIVAVGLKVEAYSIVGMYDIVEAIGAAMAFSVIFLTRRARLPWALAFLIGWLVLEFTISLRPLGYEPDHITMSGLYNRFGWALLAALFLNMIDLLRHPDEPRFGFLSGVLVALLFATKLNLGLAGMALLFPVVTLPRLPQKRFWIKISVTLTTTTTLIFIAFHIHPTAFLSDQLVVAAAMPFDRKLSALSAILSKSRGDLLVAAISVSLALSYDLWRRPNGGALRTSALFIGTLAAALVAEIGSISLNEMLLVFLSPIAITTLPSCRGGFVTLLVGLLVLGLSFKTIKMNFASYSLRQHLATQVNDQSVFQRLDSERLKDLYFMTWKDQVGLDRMSSIARDRRVEWSPASMVFQANRGFDLLRPFLRTGDTLLNLFDDQSFSYVFGASHVKGDALLYHVGRTNSVPLPTDIAAVVDRATWILTPRELPVWGNLEVIKAYFPFVQATHRVKAENEYWKLWGR